MELKHLKRRDVTMRVSLEKVAAGLSVNNKMVLKAYTCFKETGVVLKQNSDGYSK